MLGAVIGNPVGAPVMDTATAFGKLYDVFIAGIGMLGDRAGAAHRIGDDRPV